MPRLPALDVPPGPAVVFDRATLNSPRYATPDTRPRAPVCPTRQPRRAVSVAQTVADDQRCLTPPGSLQRLEPLSVTRRLPVSGGRTQSLQAGAAANAGASSLLLVNWRI